MLLNHYCFEKGYEISHIWLSKVLVAVKILAITYIEYVILPYKQRGKIKHYKIQSFYTFENDLILREGCLKCDLMYCGGEQKKVLNGKID